LLALFLVSAGRALCALSIATSIGGPARWSLPISATQHAGIGWAHPDPDVFNSRETARYYHRLLAAA